MLDVSEADEAVFAHVNTSKNAALLNTSAQVAEPQRRVSKGKVTHRDNSRVNHAKSLITDGSIPRHGC